MNVILDKLREWMGGKENEHLEFKKAENHFDFEELVRYCAAMANEGSGKMILGVTNKQPRVVVGSQAFLTHNQVQKLIVELKNEGKIFRVGRTNAARWFPAELKTTIAPDSL